ncbi:uncharacterized protein LOC123309723 [Coccinella septempunctata]|uniref:uncharacterized protein LOC123309723 n=2 Tax=Coccinella septempunctata TaxID=41139 RepID=UPI001D07B837|nr:uncharacterized protein LOC123309723 [Coccinella septempunctata]
MLSGTDGPAYPSRPTSKVSSLEVDVIVAPIITRSMKQGGRGQRAGPLRSRLEEEPDGVSCGASGAAPRDGTVSQILQPLRRERRSISLDGIRTRPAEDPYRQDGRTRWNEEENILLLRVHYIAKDLELNRNANYRQALTNTWNDLNPLKQSYANLLSNRVRWLLNNEKFTETELFNIKLSCYPRGAVVDHNENSAEEAPAPTPLAVENTPKAGRLERALIKNYLLYAGLPPESRPRIPRLKGSKVMLQKVKDLNDIMQTNLLTTWKLENVVDYVYAGAITICSELGIEIKNTQPKKKEAPPPWKHRLEKKINDMRKNIGIIHTYLNSEAPSKRVEKLTRRIASAFKIKARNNRFRESVTEIYDRLKQKIKVLGSRLQRYNERIKRYQNNQLYYRNKQQFFRLLEQEITDDGSAPTEESMHSFWSKIWEEDKKHDDRAHWIRDAEAESAKFQMEDINITTEHIRTALKKTNNWSSPGVDKIQNYWWKHFTASHEHLARLFRETLTDPTRIPEFFTLGVTHMLPKGINTTDPKKYRPITCLPTIYKILTGVLTSHIWQHVNKNNIMEQEQNGCRGNSRGCKELLITDLIVTRQAKKKQRNISMAWVDYQKAFDSVPHTWLIKTLQLYGISRPIINLLEHLMKTWRTQLVVNTKQENYKTAVIRIRRGIFQGDTLSPLWFCLALNPLSRLLKNQIYGYILQKARNIKINHQFYVDDLKLYAANEEQLKKQLRIVAAFSKDIGMELGIDKCAVVHVKRGRVQEGTGLSVMEDLTIPQLGKQESYKYLGVQQALDIKTTEMKNTYKEKFLNRLKKVLQSRLNSKAMFEAVNIWAIPCIAYSFGVIKWSNSELKEIDKRARALLTKQGIHHPHASMNRLYVPRHEGGRGLQNLEIVHDRTVRSMREYFQKKNSPFHRAVCQEDNNLSPLNLAGHLEPARLTTEMLIQEWHSKALHGRYPGCLKNNQVKKKESLTYLTAGYLFPETEGRLIAIQDQVVPTRSYIKNITGRNIPTDKCRKCSQVTESIQHVTSSCSVLAPVDYMQRHNAMAKVYHQAIAKKYGLITKTVKPFEYCPNNILENEGYKLYWDNFITTDRPIQHNRPDILLFKKKERTIEILDVAIPADDNIQKAFVEKLTKYHDLAFEMKTMYGLKSTSIVPLVMSTNGLVETHLVDNTLNLGLDKELVSTAQKEVILANTKIVRKFLTSV